MAWVIEHKYETDDNGALLCWSNSEGWVSETYDTFTEEERYTLPLPIDGKWIYVLWSGSPEELTEEN